VKALYRRGLAYVDSGDWDIALVDYDKALELEPENKAVAKARAKVLHLKAQQDKKDRLRYKNLLSVIGDERSNINTNEKKKDEEKIDEEKIDEEKIEDKSPMDVDTQSNENKSD